MPTQTIIVDTLRLLYWCLEDIAPTTLAPGGLTISVDVEGVELCRAGRVCIVQFHVSGSSYIWLLDVVALGQQAFDAIDWRGRSVRGVLQGTAARKLLYDVRNDSDALYNLHGVYLQNVCDVQLLELALRYHTNQKTERLNGLKRALETYLTLPRASARIKEDGIALFSPERGVATRSSCAARWIHGS
ncbi:hypothetical protein BD779DRAFT_1672429 [Infundibulicybe gibba]|nr:hypothetical protein BD779DRAFT_1672429 [Infundibulicybe gibba]